MISEVDIAAMRQDNEAFLTQSPRLGGWIPVDNLDKAIIQMKTLVRDKGEVMNSKLGEESIRGSVLREANSIVNGARASTYGGPEDSFKTIGKLWEAYYGTPFTPATVAVFLALLKVARLRNSPDHRDSWVDLAGYAACGAECSLQKGKPEQCKV